jgi:hypothetical protein
MVVTLVVAATLAIVVARPLVERRSAKTACVESNGKWDSDAGVCDYGPGGAVVRLLEQGKRCRNLPDSSLRECAYSVERLTLNVIGVGTANAAVSIDGSDEESGYGVGIFMGEGCIRVAPGTHLKELDPLRRIEDGFVSTWTGEVSDSLTMCRLARGESPLPDPRP